MRRTFLGSLAFVAIVSAVPAAQAHIELTYPPPRTTDLKPGPCGQMVDARSGPVTTLEAGAKITVTWDETIEHPGHYRIMFDEDGSDGFTKPTAETDVCTPGTGGCLADNIADQVKGATPLPYSQEVRLPNVECDNCTLQVIQVMTDKTADGWGNNEFYFQCADIVLKAAGGGGTGGSGGSSGEPGGTPDGGEEDDGGCSVRAVGQGGGVAAAALAALGLLAVGARRRRR